MSGNEECMLNQITALFMTMRAWDILDILVVTLFLYNLYVLTVSYTHLTLPTKA